MIAPALKRRDVGIVWESRVRSSKKRSAVGFNDDNFFNLVKAINNGKIIFGHQNAIQFFAVRESCRDLAVV